MEKTGLAPFFCTNIYYYEVKFKMANTLTNNIKSILWKNKLLTLLGTYSIAFISIEGFPVPIILMLLNFNEIILKISSIGFMLGIFSIIGVVFVIINKHKKKLRWMIFQLTVACLMYISWLFLAIYGNNNIGGDFDRLGFFTFWIVMSAPFQIAFLIYTKELIEEIFLIKLNKIIIINVKPFFYILLICFLYLFLGPR